MVSSRDDLDDEIGEIVDDLVDYVENSDEASPEEAIIVMLHVNGMARDAEYLTVVDLRDEGWNL